MPTEHDGAVEKDEYVRSARHIHDEADCEMERVMHSAMARPWQFGNTAVALGAVMRTALDELTALDPSTVRRLAINHARGMAMQIVLYYGYGHAIRHEPAGLKDKAIQRIPISFG